MPLVLLALTASIGCGDRIRVWQTRVSPDHAYVARFYSLSGGGAAGYDFGRVDVRPRSVPFDSLTEDFIFEATGGQIAIHWEGLRKLVVEHEPKTNVYRRRESSGAVLIEYQSVLRSEAEWSRLQALGEGTR